MLNVPDRKRNMDTVLYMGLVQQVQFVGLLLHDANFNTDLSGNHYLRENFVS